MFYVIQLPEHGYGYDPEVAASVVALNDNISHIDLLPPVGNTIFIPRPPRQLQRWARAPRRRYWRRLVWMGLQARCFNPGSNVGCYEVESGDSIVAIAEQYSTTLEILSQLNKKSSFSVVLY